MKRSESNDQTVRSRSERSHRLILEIRDSRSVLICQHCEKPILEIVEGEISIGSKHGSSKHTNVLTIEYLQMLVFEMQRQKRI